MTENEMAAEMGATVKELAELRKSRICLQSRAERVAKNFRSIATRLDLAGTGQSEMRSEPRNLAEIWATPKDVHNLMTELTSTTTRIAELENRLREWGAIS